MSSITTILGTDVIATSRTDINTNFSNLNTDKIETSYLDTDTSLTANSNTKIATQAAVKAYVDAGGNVNASETTKGIVQEATDAQVTAGTATGATGAKLFVTPAKLATIITGLGNIKTSSATAGQSFTGATLPQPAWIGDGTGTDAPLNYNSGGTATMLASFGYSGIGGALRVAKKVVIGAGSSTVFNKIISRMSATGGGSSVKITASVETDGANSPSGTILGTSDTQNIVGAAQDCTNTFTTPIDLPTGTYWLILTSSDAAGTGGELIGTTTGGSSSIAYYDSGAWGVNANHDFRIKATMTYIAGYIYLTNTALTEAKQFDGWVLNTVSLGATTTQFISGYGGQIITGFTGLTLGGLYYCDGNGVISLTTTSGLIVGRAISTTTIFSAKTID